MHLTPEQGAEAGDIIRGERHRPPEAQGVDTPEARAIITLTSCAKQTKHLERDAKVITTHHRCERWISPSAIKRKRAAGSSDQLLRLRLRLAHTHHTQHTSFHQPVARSHVTARDWDQTGARYFVGFGTNTTKNQPTAISAKNVSITRARCVGHQA